MSKLAIQECKKMKDLIEAGLFGISMLIVSTIFAILFSLIINFTGPLVLAILLIFFFFASFHYCMRNGNV